MSKCLSFSLYYISFLPLWVSVAFIDIKSLAVDKTENPYTEIISITAMLSMLVVCGILSMIQIGPRGHGGTRRYAIKTAREQKTVTADFLLAYIMPLFAFEFTEWYGVVLFLIFFGIFWYLTSRHNLFSANIVLDIAGFRFYECVLLPFDQTASPTEIETTVMSRRKLISLKGEEINIKSLNNEIKLDVDA